jgi:hypothetical protein
MAFKIIASTPSKGTKKENIYFSLEVKIS